MWDWGGCAVYWALRSLSGGMLCKHKWQNQGPTKSRLCSDLTLPITTVKTHTDEPRLTCHLHWRKEQRGWRITCTWFKEMTARAGGKKREEGRWWPGPARGCPAHLVPLTLQVELKLTGGQRLWPEPWQATQVLAWHPTWPCPRWRGHLPQRHFCKKREHQKSYPLLKNQNRVPHPKWVFSH